MATLGIAVVGPFAAAAATAKRPVHVWANPWFGLGLVAIVLGVSLFLVAPAFSARPVLSLVCGNAGDFRKVVNAEARHLSPDHPSTVWSVHMTRLLVTETEGVWAHSVHVQLVSAMDPVPAGLDVSGRRGLQWIEGQDVYDVPPRGRGFVRLCERIEDVNGVRILTSIPTLEPGSTFTFGLSAVVGGEEYRAVFRADWSDPKAFYPTMSAVTE